MSNTHPNVLWRKHYGKAAWNHKEPLCAAGCLTHSIQGGPDNMAATLTFTLPSLSALSLLARQAQKVCLLYPFRRECSARLAKSAPHPSLQEHTAFRLIPRLQQLALYLLLRKKPCVVREKRIIVLISRQTEREREGGCVEHECLEVNTVSGNEFSKQLFSVSEDCCRLSHRQSVSHGRKAHL